jgi:hypothetical protein
MQMELMWLLDPLLQWFSKQCREGGSQAGWVVHDRPACLPPAEYTNSRDAEDALRGMDRLYLGGKEIGASFALQVQCVRCCRHLLRLHILCT